MDSCTTFNQFFSGPKMDPLNTATWLEPPGSNESLRMVFQAILRTILLPFIFFFCRFLKYASPCDQELKTSGANLVLFYLMFCLNINIFWPWTSVESNKNMLRNVWLRRCVQTCSREPEASGFENTSHKKITRSCSLFKNHIFPNWGP